MSLERDRDIVETMVEAVGGDVRARALPDQDVKGRGHLGRCTDAHMIYVKHGCRHNIFFPNGMPLPNMKLWLRDAFTKLDSVILLYSLAFSVFQFAFEYLRNM